jgi:hypothetical protein
MAGDRDQLAWYGILRSEPRLRKWSECYGKDAVVASTYKAGKGSVYLGDTAVVRPQRTAPCMSTAIVRGVVRCFNSISEGDEESGSSMLMSAGKGRAEI